MKLVRNTCNTCLYRHGCFYGTQNNHNCKHWKLGKCYTCKFIDAPEEEWFKRGCEVECFSGCKNYKRSWKKTFSILKMKLIGG